MSDAPDMPDGAMLQSVSVNDEGQVSGYRIYTDGRYETKRAGGAWQPEDPLDSSLVERVAAAIAAADLSHLDPRYAPERLPEHRSTLWMQVDAGGRRSDIEIVGSCDVPAIRALTTQLVEIFRDA